LPLETIGNVGETGHGLMPRPVALFFVSVTVVSALLYFAWFTDAAWMTIALIAAAYGGLVLVTRLLTGRTRVWLGLMELAGGVVGAVALLGLASLADPLPMLGGDGAYVVSSALVLAVAIASIAAVVPPRRALPVSWAVFAFGLIYVAVAASLLRWALGGSAAGYAPDFVGSTVLPLLLHVPAFAFGATIPFLVASRLDARRSRVAIEQARQPDASWSVR
jgi:hypothetical protein